MSISYSVNELINKLNTLKKEIENETNKLLDDTLDVAETNMKLLAPVDTGYLRDNIEQNKTDKTIEVNCDYAIYQEHGTSQFKPQPFFYPSINIAKNYVNKEFKLRINKAIKRSGLGWI